MNRFRKTIRPFALTLMISALPVMTTLADDKPADYVNPETIKWENAPPSLPKGAKMAVLYGDPGKAGPYTLRLKAPAGYKIPPHWHSQDENLTILSGALYLGKGDKAESASAHALKAGGFHHLPAKTHHYAFTKAPTVIQIHGEGPFDIVYIDPKDNPETKATK